MDTRFIKIWKDLWVRKARTLVTLIGLTIGWWGIGTVCFMYMVLGNDLKENYSRTQPAHILLPTDSPTTVDTNKVVELEGVLGVEDRPRIVTRLEVAPDHWMVMVLFVVEDFNDLRVNRFWPQEGAWPPPTGSMLIERDGVNMLRAAAINAVNPGTGHGNGEIRVTPEDPMKSPITVRLPGGLDITTKISGTVFDPGQAPSSMERMYYGYVTRETAAEWIPDEVASRVVVRVDPSHAQSPLAISEQIQHSLQQDGLEIGQVMYPPADKHPHQFQMNSIMLMLAGVGVVALLLSIVLVLNLINSLLTNQIRQIGSLKAIGATSRQVAFMYWASLAMLGLAACLIALPLARTMSYRLSYSLADILNFEIITTQLPWWFYAGWLLAGSLFPVLAAFFPVRHWSGVPVRDALDNYGVAQNATRDSLIENMRLPLPRNFRLGLSNGLRNPKRFALGVGALSVGTLAFMVTMNLKSSLLNTASIQDSTVLYDVQVAFEDNVKWEQINWITKFPFVTNLELWPTTGVTPRGLSAKGERTYSLIAVPDDTQALLPNIIKGHWISPSDPKGIVVSHRFMLQNPELNVGDSMTLEIGNRTIDFTIRGINKQFSPPLMYLTLSSYLEITGTSQDIGRRAMITLKEGFKFSTPARFMPLLEQHFDQSKEINVSMMQSSKMASMMIRNHLDIIVYLLAIMAALMLFVSALGMASGVSSSVIERTRELGVLRAIGATPATLIKILSAESLSIALFAWLLSLAIATPISRAISDYFGTGFVKYPFDYLTSSEGIWLSLVVVVILTLLATAGPARMSTRQEVGTAVNYE